MKKSSTRPIPDDMSNMSLSFKAASTRHLEDVSFDMTCDVLDGLTVTEDKYQCRDYLKRRSLRKQQACRSSPKSVTDGDEDEDEEEEPVDATCRWKMCEWSYRVSEHFQISREIVAIAFDILDRFVDKCCCDRTVFKLASMTTFYMATKLFHSKQISIQTLSDLSRGEFESNHIAEMESIILQTLNWNVNPPTIHAFLNGFHALLPYDDSSRMDTVYQRACFFAELSVYDYEFVTDGRRIIAAACVLNAMEGLLERDDDNVTKQLDFLEIVPGPALDLLELNAVRERLWSLYACSPQREQDAAAAGVKSKRMTKMNKATSRRRKSLLPLRNHSPVSVVEGDLGSSD
jgi:hypothetical protein